MNSRAAKPKASLGETEAIKTVLGVLKVKGLIIPVKRAASIGSVGSAGSGSGSEPCLALCDGTVVDGAASSSMVQVQSLEDSFAALKSLRLEVEAHTWNYKKARMIVGGGQL